MKNYFTIKDTNTIKGIAVCLMLVHHLFYSWSHIDKCRLLVSKLGYLLIQFAQTCKVCVAIFLFLSGYGIYKSYQKFILNNKPILKNDVKFVYLHIKQLIVNYWWAVVPFAIFGIVTGLRTFSDVYGTGTKSVFYFLFDIFGISGKTSINNMYNITCWYIAVALVLYLLFPILYKLLEKNDTLFLALVLIIAYLPLKPLLLVDRIWILPFSFGMFFSKHNLLDWFLKKLNNKYIIITFLSLIICAVLRLFLHTYLDAFYSISVICSIIIIINSISIIGVIFEFIGRYSANIFMIHTFLFKYYFQKIIYFPKFPLLIFIFLLLTSLVYSILLEKVKTNVNILLKRKFNKSITN